MHTTKILAALTVATSAVALAACADPTTNTTSAGQSATAASSNTAAYDVSQIPTDPTIAALVPEEVKKRGTLRNGASTGYAPAEYMATDGQTPIGYDIDINKALAKVMGLEEGTTQHSEFPTIIPALGTKFDVGISSFTITSEREQQVNMGFLPQRRLSVGRGDGQPEEFRHLQPLRHDDCRADGYRAGDLRARAVQAVRG